MLFVVEGERDGCCEVFGKFPGVEEVNCVELNGLREVGEIIFTGVALSAEKETIVKSNDFIELLP